MSSSNVLRVAVLSVPKHEYVVNGVAAHPRFQIVVVADDADQPDWVHERNEGTARKYGVPYVREVAKAMRDFNVQVACISSQAERHCDLAARAANAGLHVVLDKPMSTKVSECDRAVEAVARNKVKFMMWNRNGLPALVHAHEALDQGAVGLPYAVHVDFYFAKDAGPPKGSRKPGDPPLDWQQYLIAAHADGSDGGVGTEPMGELKIEGIYPLAYLRLLTGAEVRRVFARTTAHFHQLNADNNVEDLATVTMEMDHGIVGTLCIGRIGRASHPDAGEIKIHVLGSEGGMVISEPRPEVAVYHRGQAPKAFRHRRIAGENDWVLMESFARAIDTDGDTMLDARAGRAICATVEAAIQSGRTGKPVAVA